jgi:phosphonate transport system substrate-binding protein
MNSMWLKLGAMLAALVLGATCQAAGKPYAFGVLNQRSLQATAAYWNPILSYVSARSGVPLELHIGRTANETTDRIVAAQLDFAYTNHLFTPKRTQLGWRVLARQDSSGIRGQVVVLDASPVKTLGELNGKTVAFANPYAFVGYYVPMDALLRAGVRVAPLFSGNQEAAMGQLMSGQVAAAGVNHQVMADFARRRALKYRVLSESEPYFDLAVMASPRVGASDGEKVRQAFVNMARDPEGQRVLHLSAQALDLPKARGFAPADDRDYSNYVTFFKHTQVELNE